MLKWRAPKKEIENNIRSLSMENVHKEAEQNETRWITAEEKKHADPRERKTIEKNANNNDNNVQM